MKALAALLMGTAALIVGGNTTAATKNHPSATSIRSNHHAQPFVHKSKLKTLYDQNDNDEGIGTVSQNFESSFDQYDSQGADDFIVPSGAKWRVSEIDVTGVYFNGAGLAVSENVYFYKDLGGLPSTVVHAYPDLLGVDNGAGSFVITLPGKGAKLKAGHYWVSVQVNMDFSKGGEWGWEKQSTVELNRAAWQNPGNGFGTGCTTWGIENDCLGLGPNLPPTIGETGDHMFALKGKTKGG